MNFESASVSDVSLSTVLICIVAIAETNSAVFRIVSVIVKHFMIGFQVEIIWSLEVYWN
jgi:hypothetical protein